MILIISNINYPLTLQLIETLSEYIDDDIDLLSFEKSRILETINNNYYRNCFIVDCNSEKKSKLNKLRFYYKITKAIFALERYDVISIQYVSIKSLLFLPLLKYKAKRITLTFWGSDLINLSNLSTLILKLFRNYIDVVTFTNDIYRNKFLDNKFLQSYCSRANTIRFGLKYLQKNLLSETASKQKKYLSKRKLAINPTKIVLTCGYNASKNQQHIEIIKKLDELDDLTKKKIFLILPLTYGNIDKEYFSTIKELIDGAGYEYLILTEYLNDDEVQSLRYASDVMLQLQKRDQMSGSMTEHLFASNIVVKGKWLDYPVLNANDIKLYDIVDFTALPTLIFDIINNFEYYQSTTIKNALNVYNIFSWESNIEDWKKLFGIK